MDPRIALLRTGLDSGRAAVSLALDAAPDHLRDLSPGSGRWSVAEVLEHLVQTERAVTRLLTSSVKKALPRPPGEAFSEEAFLGGTALPRLLDRSSPIKGPQPAGELDAAAAWTALGRTRGELLGAVERGAGLRLEVLTYTHPFVGDLDLYQWISFVGLHEARHAAQLVEIVDRLSAGG